MTAYCKIATFRLLAVRSSRSRPGRASRIKVLADSADGPDDAYKRDGLDEHSPNTTPWPLERNRARRKSFRICIPCPLLRASINHSNNSAVKDDTDDDHDDNDNTATMTTNTTTMTKVTTLAEKGTTKTITITKTRVMTLKSKTTTMKAM